MQVTTMGTEQRVGLWGQEAGLGRVPNTTSQGPFVSVSGGLLNRTSKSVWPPHMREVRRAGHALQAMIAVFREHVEEAPLFCNIE